MAVSDRAFHLLASERPEVFHRLVVLTEPGLFAAGAPIPESLDESRLDLPPAIDADYVARVGDTEVLHAEFQGYRDAGFLGRLFRYHLALTLRYPRRRVRTVAIWLVRPPAAQRRDEITISGITVRLTALVLAEIPASVLLGHPDTACFAPGADAEGRSAEELCAMVTQALKAGGASTTQWLVASVVAAANGRYTQMVQAMREANLEPVIIEDLVRYGLDQGYERGVREGIEKGRREGVEQGLREGVEKSARDSLLAVLAARGLALSAAQRERIDAEADVERIHTWIVRAAVAPSADGVLE